ncbi:MAG: CBS domain-containing protein [Rhodospirillaceae bacterium]|nr:CBS domain-containing protein [Rhodospirillaceae bacterium]MBT7267224.1 CBS domain-containing protein [Rhodospirillaceae bacterium]
MKSQTALFSKLVKGSMRPVPLKIPETTCREAVMAMRDSESSAVVIIGANNHPAGIITEQDVARRLAFDLEPDMPVSKVMTSPVQTIAEKEFLFHAIAVMRRNNIRHMPVLDRGGSVTGLLRLKDALFSSDESLMKQIDILTKVDDVDGFIEIKQAQVDLAAQLMADNVPVPEILALLTQINNDIYHRVTDCTIMDMEQSGKGPPPVDFSVIVMGSGGRGENFIFPDQDNGLILEDYPDDQHNEIDAWFIPFSESLTNTMDRIGFPLCNGHVMATNPLWRKTRSQWAAQVDQWSRRRNTTALRLCDILFDFRAVWGENDFADELRRHITEVCRSNKSFLRDMEAEDQDNGIALGFFDRFITAKDDDEHKGMMNLKQSGSLPLIEAVRLVSLREGHEVLSTLGRIDCLLEQGNLDLDEHDYLSGSYNHIVELILRQQIQSFKAGGEVSYYIYPDSMTTREKDVLIDSFKAIRRYRDRVRSEFSGDIF